MYGKNPAIDLAAGMRREARDLYQSGKFNDAINLVHGLASLGEVHYSDPLLLAVCHQALGDQTAAEDCLKTADQILGAQSRHVRRLRR